MQDMNFTHFVGWDVSKATLDYCLLDAQRVILEQGKIKNNRKAISKQLGVWIGKYQLTSSTTLHCMEKTGHYCNPMISVIDDELLQIWLEDPVQLKHSMGRRKDKTDKADAHMIAEYAVNHGYKAKLYAIPKEISVQINDLSKARLKLVRYKQALATSQKEKKQFELYPTDPAFAKILSETIAYIQGQIDALDRRIVELIKQDAEARRIYKVALSVPGIGRKNIVTILAITGFFEKIASPRACASYAGVSPHENQSGSSIRYRSRVSKASNKELKTAFHLGAINLIRSPSLFKDIFDRQTEKGHNFRKAINAVRNKMINVLYACLRKDTMYDKKYHESFG